MSIRTRKPAVSKKSARTLRDNEVLMLIKHLLPIVHGVLEKLTPAAPAEDRKTLKVPFTLPDHGPEEEVLNDKYRRS